MLSTEPSTSRDRASGIILTFRSLEPTSRFCPYTLWQDEKRRGAQIVVEEIRGAHRKKQWTKPGLSYDIAAVVWIRASYVVLGLAMMLEVVGSPGGGV